MCQLYPPLRPGFGLLYSGVEVGITKEIQRATEDNSCIVPGLETGDQQSVLSNSMGVLQRLKYLAIWDSLQPVLMRSDQMFPVIYLRDGSVGEEGVRCRGASEDVQDQRVIRVCYHAGRQRENESKDKKPCTLQCVSTVMVLLAVTYKGWF